MLHPTAQATPLMRFFVWLAAVSTAGVSAFVRIATEAEFAFASAVIVPVIAVAWFVSKKSG